MCRTTEEQSVYRSDPLAERSLAFLHALFGMAWLLAVVFIHSTLTASSNLAASHRPYIAHLLLQVDELFLVPAMAGVLVTSVLRSLLTERGFRMSRWTRFSWLLTVGLVVLNTGFLGPWIIRMSSLSAASWLGGLSDLAYQVYWGMLLGLTTVQLPVLLVQLVVRVVPYIPARFRRVEIQPIAARFSLPLVQDTRR